MAPERDFPIIYYPTFEKRESFIQELIAFLLLYQNPISFAITHNRVPKIIREFDADELTQTYEVIGAKIMAKKQEAEKEAIKRAEESAKELRLAQASQDVQSSKSQLPEENFPVPILIEFHPFWFWKHIVLYEGEGNERLEIRPLVGIHLKSSIERTVEVDTQYAYDFAQLFGGQTMLLYALERAGGMLDLPTLVDALGYSAAGAINASEIYRGITDELWSDRRIQLYETNIYGGECKLFFVCSHCGRVGNRINFGRLEFVICDHFKLDGGEWYAYFGKDKVPRGISSSGEEYRDRVKVSDLILPAISSQARYYIGEQWIEANIIRKKDKEEWKEWASRVIEGNGLGSVEVDEMGRKILNKDARRMQILKRVQRWAATTIIQVATTLADYIRDPWQLYLIKGPRVFTGARHSEIEGEIELHLLGLVAKTPDGRYIPVEQALAERMSDARALREKLSALYFLSFSAIRYYLHRIQQHMLWSTKGDYAFIVYDYRSLFLEALKKVWGGKGPDPQQGGVYLIPYEATYGFLTSLSHSFSPSGGIPTSMSIKVAGADIQYGQVRAKIAFERWYKAISGKEKLSAKDFEVIELPVKLDAQAPILSEDLRGFYEKKEEEGEGSTMGEQTPARGSRG